MQDPQKIFYEGETGPGQRGPHHPQASFFPHPQLGSGSSPRPQGSASGPAALGIPRGFRSEAAACARPLTARGGGRESGERSGGRAERDGAASASSALTSEPRGGRVWGAPEPPPGPGPGAGPVPPQGSGAGGGGGPRP